MPENENVIDDMHKKAFDFLYKRVKDRQINFYAFLNKEFNILNYKSARCSMHCFDDPSVPLREANECLSVCRLGIQGCKDFAMEKQKTAEDDLEGCHQQAQDLSSLTDPVIHWISCYEKLIKKMDVMESEIKTEFSNFI